WLSAPSRDGFAAAAACGAEGAAQQAGSPTLPPLGAPWTDPNDRRRSCVDGFCMRFRGECHVESVYDAVQFVPANHQWRPDLQDVVVRPNPTDQDPFPHESFDDPFGQTGIRAA